MFFRFFNWDGYGSIKREAPSPPPTLSPSPGSTPSPELSLPPSPPLLPRPWRVSHSLDAKIPVGAVVSTAVTDTSVDNLYTKQNGSTPYKGPNDTSSNTSKQSSEAQIPVGAVVVSTAVTDTSVDNLYTQQNGSNPDNGPNDTSSNSSQQSSEPQIPVGVVVYTAVTDTSVDNLNTKQNGSNPDNGPNDTSSNSSQQSSEPQNLLKILKEFVVNNTSNGDETRQGKTSLRDRSSKSKKVVIQLYCAQKTDLTEFALQELKSKLASELVQDGLDLDIQIRTTHSDIKDHIPLILVCLCSSSLSTEFSNAVSGIPMVIQLYCAQKTDLTEFALQELKRKLASELAQDGLDLDIRIHTTHSDIKDHIPLILVCLCSSSLNADFSNAVSGIPIGSNTAVLIVHHLKQHALPTIPSKMLLTKAVVQTVGIIIDVAFYDRTGLYDCDMNTIAYKTLRTFIKDHWYM